VTERVREIAISEGEYEMLKRVFQRSADQALAVFLHRLAWELFGRERADAEWPGPPRET
jgi:hypothetical protein